LSDDKPQTNGGRWELTNTASKLKGDLLSGLVVALLSLPMTIPLGALALSPLGPDYVAVGVAAGFQSSIVAGIVSALAGGSRYQISGPRASISLVTAGAIAIALGHGAVGDQALLVGYLVVFLAGFLQVAFGLAKFGRVVKYIPYPVLAGFMNGVAILIVMGQLAAAVGLPSSLPWTALWSHRADISIPAVVVTLVTMVVMRLAPRVTKAVPAIVVAFIVGVAVEQVLRHVLGGAVMGPLVGALSGGMPTPRIIGAVVTLPWQDSMAGWMAAEAPTILVLALVGSIEALLSAAAIDAVTGDHHDGDRELIGQGLGNCLCACFGGVASTGAPIRGITSYKVGGRSRLAGVFHSLVLLALLLWGKSLLMELPYSVMAGIMIMIAVSMNDTWAFVLVRNSGRRFLADCAVVVVVAATTVVANLAFAVFCGIVLTLLLFMLRMSRPVVRRVFDRTGTKSRRERPLGMEEFLSREGHRIVIMELDGPLFFGTAERFRDDVERLSRREMSILILDLRRVRYFDLSGVRMLGKIGQTQKQLGRKVYLAGIEASGSRRDWLISAGITASIPPFHLFPLLDFALEAAEGVIGSAFAEDDEEELPLSRFEVLSGLPTEDLFFLSELLQRTEYKDAEAVFHKNDDGDGVYLLASGSIDICLPGTAEGMDAVRLATFAPGTIFGEMALLGGPQVRSATAIATKPAVSYFLSNANFTALHDQRPAAAARILLNIGREMAERLRLANTRLQAEAR
jgi:MFS superfamily sulfate permease-like transporter/CRP-like cAMP-binding protein